jgi:hypothetical protein
MTKCPELMRPDEICGPAGTMDSEGILGNFIAFLLMDAKGDPCSEEFGDKLVKFIESRRATSGQPDAGSGDR